jgi:hypothetical protein
MPESVPILLDLSGNASILPIKKPEKTPASFLEKENNL